MTLAMIAALDFATFSGMTALLLVCSFGVMFMIRFFAALSAETRRPKVHMVRINSPVHAGLLYEFPKPKMVPLRKVRRSAEAIHISSPSA